MVSPSGLHLNKPLVFSVVGLLVGLVLVYKLWWSDSSLGSFSAFNFGLAATKDTKSLGSTSAAIGGVINVGQLASIPTLSDDTIASLKKDHAVSKMENITVDGKIVSVYLEQVIPLKDGTPPLNILLLHGAAFSSADWLKINTVYHLAHWGYRAIAVDLPGKGKSPAMDAALKSDQFLGSLISSLQIKDLVIVSPSMSGGYSLPYLFSDPSKSTEKAAGFIPIAPVRTGDFVDSYKSCQLPTLIVYGENDKSLGPASLKDLSHLPLHQTAMIPEAGHPAYMDQPDVWHKVLYSWLNSLATKS